MPEKIEEDRTPEEIEAEIERTRRELGDTVAAVAEKADVKAQARAKVEETKQAASDRAVQSRDRVVAGVLENPVPAAAGAAALLVILVALRRRSR